MTTRGYGLQEHNVQPTHSLVSLKLVAQIVSYLADDARTLLACSSTCHLWCNATRPHIFRTITIGGPPRLQEFCDLVKGSPDIGLWTKEIYFTSSRPPISKHFYPFNWMIDAGEILRGLEENLTELSSITFDTIFVGSDPADSISLFDILANFRTIRHINIHMCFPSLTPFCNFLCKLPLLESVSIEDSSPLSIEGTTEGTGLIKISSLSLLTLQWDQINTRTWFTSVITAASLRNLVIDVLKDSYLGVTNRLLELTGPYLQSLVIILPGYHEQVAQDPLRLGTYDPSVATALLL